MKKILTLFFLVLCSVVLQARTLYLNTGGSQLWNQGDAKFAIYYFNPTEDNGWSNLMTLVSGDIYQADVPDGYSSVIFVRLSADATAGDWSKKWNQTADLTLGTDDMYTITAWGEGNASSMGSWSAYQPGGGGGESGDDDDAWYYKGHIDGKDIEPNDATKFVNGVVEFSCTQKSYLMVIYQKKGVPGVQYMTETYVDGGDNCVLKNTTTSNKWGIDPYTGNLYLYYGDDATQVILSKVEIPGRQLIGAGQSALPEMNAKSPEVVKYISNGQLIIKTNDKALDVLGRKIQ